MKPFAAPLDDILFTLEHVADAGSLMDWDRDTASEIGAHFATFAEAEIAPLDEEGDRDGAQATIVEHAEIRRMLDEIDALALGGRAISHLAYVLMESGTERDLVEFLTPIAKVYCSTAGMKAAELGMQVLGGYGYLHEYRLEQTYRDVRITAIYEGANGIHERALVTRLLHGPGGDAFANFIGARAPGIHKQWIAARDIMATHDDPAPFAHDFLAFSCEALLLVLFARMAAASEHHPDPNRISRVCEHAIRRGAARLAYRANLLTT